jgi:hypothetical protein
MYLTDCLLSFRQAAKVAYYEFPGAGKGVSAASVPRILLSLYARVKVWMARKIAMSVLKDLLICIIDGTTTYTDRCPIAIRFAGGTQETWWSYLVGFKEAADHTAQTQLEMIIEIIKELNSYNEFMGDNSVPKIYLYHIGSVAYDTTGSNTGRTNGFVSFLLCVLFRFFLFLLCCLVFFVFSITVASTVFDIDDVAGHPIFQFISDYFISTSFCFSLQTSLADKFVLYVLGLFGLLTRARQTAWQAMGDPSHLLKDLTEIRCQDHVLCLISKDLEALFVAVARANMPYLVYSNKKGQERHQATALVKHITKRLTHAPLVSLFKAFVNSKLGKKKGFSFHRLSESRFMWLDLACQNIWSNLDIIVMFFVLFRHRIKGKCDTLLLLLLNPTVRFIICFRAALSFHFFRPAMHDANAVRTKFQLIRLLERKRRFGLFLKACPCRFIECLPERQTVAFEEQAQHAVETVVKRNLESVEWSSVGQNIEIELQGLSFIFSLVSNIKILRIRLQILELQYYNLMQRRMSKTLAYQIWRMKSKCWSTWFVRRCDFKIFSNNKRTTGNLHERICRC